MSRRNCARLVLVALLASLLALPVPARAAAADLASPGPLWARLADLWEQAISALWTWNDTAENKAGHGIDPNGSINPESGGTGSAPNGGTTTEGDAGHGIDPNG